MNVLDIVITLKDDCVFSERNATEGGHSALDYIPGSALLGAVAAKAYQADDLQTAFDWFHSGKLRFGNAYPLTGGGQRAYPIPACWHEAKNEPSTEGKTIDAKKVWRLDMMGGKLPQDKQPKQMRQGYVAATGELADPKKFLRMKTAIDGDKGRAKEGMLFGYDALRAGQRFHAQIQINDSFAADAIDKLKAIFEQPLLLGRSRSAEYGHATAQILDGSTDVSHESTKGGKELTLWLQSDLMLLDKFGQPNLCPSAEELGLPAGKYRADKSFVRTRRYSTWNTYKHGYEMERQVICKGGVLVFELDGAASDDDLKTLNQKLSQGVGLERQAGLGQVWLNPPLLLSEQPAFEKDVAPLFTVSASSEKSQTAETDLIAWLRKRTTGKADKQQLAANARRVAKVYSDLQKSARKLKGLNDSVFVGPSVSQLSALQNRFKNHEPINAILGSQEGAFKSAGEGWSDEFQHSEHGIISFYRWFELEVQSNSNHYYLSELVREIQGQIKSQKGGQS